VRKRATWETSSIPAFDGKRKKPNIPGFHGADEQIRTADLLITNQLLYQLSYVGIFGRANADITVSWGPQHPLSRVASD